MPRPQRNFKIRPPKFLGLHQLKFQNTGTYTGHYKGPPVSRRRLQFAKSLRRGHQHTENPLLHNILGSPLKRSPPFEAADSNRNTVYLFSHLRTSQVLYSTTRHIDPENALPQLVFYGKKTVPEKYRKDDWRPYAAVEFRSDHEGYLAYKMLRELRLLRDYAWRKPGTPAPNKAKRKKMLMDQKATSVCDLSTTITKMNREFANGELDRLMQWKAVENLALTARTGGLAIIKKQLRRAQQMLSAKRPSKKLRRWDHKQVEATMKDWYRKQTMMYKALAAVDKVHVPSALFERRVRRLDKLETLDARDSERELLRMKLSQIVEANNPSTPAPIATEEHVLEAPEQSVVERRFEYPEFTSQYSLDLNTPLSNLAQWMVNRIVNSSYRVIEASERQDSDVGTEQLVITEPADVKEKDVKEKDVKKADGKEEDVREEDPEEEDMKMAAVTDESEMESAINVFWSEIEDRQFTDNWPLNTVHYTMGPQMGKLQYAFRLPTQYISLTDNHDWPVILESEGADKTALLPAPMSRDERLKHGMPVEREIEWKPQTKKEIKKHRKGKTGLARKEWREMMGYSNESEDIKESKEGEEEEEEEETEAENGESRKETQKSETDKAHSGDEKMQDTLVAAKLHELAESNKVMEHYEQFFAKLAQKSHKSPSQPPKQTLPELIKELRPEISEIRI